MSSLNDISNARELKLVHDTQQGVVSVTQFDEYQNADFTIDIATEDFVTMLKWYLYQKEKSDNLGAIHWSEKEQTIADELWADTKNSKTVDELVASATAKYNEAIHALIASGKANEILNSDKAQRLNNLTLKVNDDVIKE